MAQDAAQLDQEVQARLLQEQEQHAADVLRCVQAPGGL